MTRLDHVVIAVSDWERSNAFYRDVAGAEIVEAGEHAWRYRFGSQQLNVHGPGGDPQPLAARPVLPGNSDLCLVWEGTLPELEAHLRAHDVALVDGPVTRYGTRGAGTSLYVRDPDGSLVEFIVYP